MSPPSEAQASSHRQEEPDNMCRMFCRQIEQRQDGLDLLAAVEEIGWTIPGHVVGDLP